MNRHKMLLNVTRRKFCSGTPYHHDYLPPPQPSGLLGIGLITFDFARIMLYVWLSMKLINHSFSFIAFKKNHFLNNPDYQLCNLETYEKIRAQQLVKMK
jgi:hypothetical protein